jgi:hypothetical protein
MGRAARERAEREFDIRVVTDEIQELYTSLLARSGRPDGTFSR